MLKSGGIIYIDFIIYRMYEWKFPVQVMKRVKMGEKIFWLFPGERRRANRNRKREKGMNKWR